MKSIVMMGVAGCGKSSAGHMLAQTLKLPLIEGDEFHPQSNQEKMRQGLPLTDEDRVDWLNTLGMSLAQQPAGAVLTCSSLKLAYRERLRSFVPGLCFVFLDIDPATALQRVTARAGEHLFPPSLVTSQFAALESPVGEPGVLQVDATQSLLQLTPVITDWLNSTHPKENT
ncbi:gluconokinase [Rhodoferax sp. PAMC 29310]|uniref:gluconokinase n=1 Tax=Rhodoferax sp. PAMC 29310 TaxID=2822760 RepID=UPI001F0A0D72|nr:gluconokinase [Rhodoferax sp. PAMC 29310]